MDTQEFTFWLVLPLIVFVEAVIIGYGWSHLKTVDGKLRTFLYGSRSGMIALALAWLVLTATAWWYEFFIALVSLHVLLFSVGRVAAGLGVVFFAALFVLTPFIWARIIVALGRQWKHRVTAYS